MNRRDFLLALSSVPAAGLLPLPSGEAPDTFYGATIERPGLYYITVLASGIAGTQIRIMADDKTLMDIEIDRSALEGGVPIVAKCLTALREGQLVHLDTVDAAQIDFHLHRMAGLQ